MHTVSEKQGGPYTVVSRDHKSFVVNIHGKNMTISIDRLKPTYIFSENSDAPEYIDVRAYQNDGERDMISRQIENEPTSWLVTENENRQKSSLSQPFPGDNEQKHCKKNCK